MKTISIIHELLDTATKRAMKAENGAGQAIVRRRPNVEAPMQEVYCVEYRSGGLSGDTVELWHYGTKTAEVWLADTPQLLHVYGESRSDADSINNFLDALGATERFTFRPVNGGFLQVK